MLRFRFLTFATLLASIVCGQASRVHYTVTVDKAVLDRTNVAMTIDGTGTKPLSIEMPSWSPGAYEMRNYWKLLTNVAAKDSKGELLELTHLENDRWTFTPRSWPVTVTYDRLEPAKGLFGSEGTKPRSAKSEHIAFNPTDTYAYVVDGKNLPCSVGFVIPDGWKLDVALDPSDKPLTFIAPDYDTLADAPVEMGKLTIHKFTVGGVPYTVTLDREDEKFPMASVENLLRPMIRNAVGMMGGKAPFARYSFQIHQGPGFGLEHLSSCTISVPYFLMKQAPGQFDTLFAHEFFHCWNIKRIRPAALGPFNYREPCRTRHLWFSEGVTDYYADIIAWRSKVTRDAEFRRSLLSEISKLQSTKARLEESVGDSSHAAFDRGYAGLSRLDYYNKGKLIGLCLDLHLRRVSQGNMTLDHVMRGLLERHGLPKPGFPEDGFFKVISEIAGVDVEPWLKRYVDGTDELPLAEAFEFIGWKLEKRAPNPDNSASRRTTRESWTLDIMPDASVAQKAAFDAWRADPYSEKVTRE